MTYQSQRAITVFETCTPASTDHIIQRAGQPAFTTGPGRRANPFNDRPSYLESCIGYICGDLQSNNRYCTNGENGRGHFPFCVTVRNPNTNRRYYGGACTNCRFQDHPEVCSFNAGGARGPVDMSSFSSSSSGGSGNSGAGGSGSGSGKGGAAESGGNDVYEEMTEVGDDEEQADGGSGPSSTTRSKTVGVKVGAKVTNEPKIKAEPLEEKVWSKAEKSSG